MAKRHVIEYFLEIEHQYLEMLDNVKDFKELFAANQLSEEDYMNAMKEIEIIKANYERIAYIMMLLGKPNKRNKKEDEVSKTWYEALKYSSKEALLDEGKDALSHIKELIKKGEIKDE